MKISNRFSKEEKGQGLVEYGLILALVSVVAVSAIGGVGNKVTNTFVSVANTDIDAKINQGYVPIASAEELNSLRDKKEQSFGEGTKWKGTYESGLDGKYIQVADIDLSGFDNWEPIGRHNHQGSFKGVYDGGGYVINNLSMVDAGHQVGLFGRTYGSTIKNAHLMDVSITGGSYLAGLVGMQYNSSTVESCSVSGDIAGAHSVGGIVGWQNSSYVKDSYTNAEVNGANLVGGLVGYQDTNSNISNSYAKGDVSGTEYYVGGLIGNQHARSIIYNSYATGNVIGDYYVGGLSGGQTPNSSINNCYSTGSVSGVGIGIGGFLGVNSGGTVLSSGWAKDINPGLDGIGESSVNSKIDLSGTTKLEIDTVLKRLIK